MNDVQTIEALKTMTSREIADLVESRHDDVKRSIERLATSGAIRLPPMADVKNSNNQTVSEYIVGERDSYVIVAQLSPAFTARLVDRWQELEFKLRNPFDIPQTMGEALRLAADLTDKVSEQAKQLAAAAPAIEFVEKYADASNTKGFRQVCKLIKANENDFRAFIKAKGVMYKLGGEWVPYPEHINAGRFEVKAGVTESGHAYSSARFTTKGVLWVAGEFAKWLLESEKV